MSNNVTIHDMIYDAYQNHWGLGEFNMSNLETLQAIVEAAHEVKSPAIIGVSMGTIRHVGLNYLRGFVQAVKAEAQVPLYFHLDHGPDMAIIETVIEMGFNSVMIDTSRLPLEENVSAVRRVVKYAHDRGVCVEAQIGETWDEETGEEIQKCTEPEEAKEFAIATGIDYLAISWGNTPGRLEGQAEVNIDLLKNIVAVTPVPIVLHGGSSIPDDKMKEAIQNGAAKVNIDTVIRKAVTQTLVDNYSVKDVPGDPRKVFKQVREASKNAVIARMQLFGSVNKAR
jgi:fructose-bisphosphate aldolase class II